MNEVSFTGTAHLHGFGRYAQVWKIWLIGTNDMTYEQCISLQTLRIGLIGTDAVTHGHCMSFFTGESRPTIDYKHIAWTTQCDLWATILLKLVGSCFIALNLTYSYFYIGSQFDGASPWLDGTCRWHVDGDRRLSYWLNFVAVVQKSRATVRLRRPTFSQWKIRWSPSSTCNYVSTRQLQNTHYSWQPLWK